MNGSKQSAHLVVNEADYEVLVEPRRLLSDVIRDDLGLTGTHVGCEQGSCGACTILVDGRAVRACLIFAVQVDGASITTIEGVARDGELSPIQQAFHESHALQCGFCTPGFVLSVCAFLAENPSPTEGEIREGLAGNLCRCTGYQNIVRAVQQASTVMNDVPLAARGADDVETVSKVARR